MLVLRTANGPKIIAPPIEIDFDAFVRNIERTNEFFGMSLYVSRPVIGSFTNKGKIDPNFKFAGEENWKD